MAKKITQKIDVSGMTIEDIMGMDLDDFNKLSERDLRAVTSRLVSASNKRIRRLEKYDIKSPALYNLGTDYRFSTKLPKGTDASQRVNKLRQEFARARTFLSSRTSTISGYKKYVSDIREEIRKSTGVSKKAMKNVDLSKAFERLHKLQESGKIPSSTGVKGSSKGSIHARDYIIEQMVKNPNITDEEIMNMTEKDYDKYYEERETEETEI